MNLPSSGTRPGGGGAAGDFLQNRPSTADNRADRVGDRQGNRQDNRGDRLDNRQDNRGDRLDNRQDLRGDRADNLQDRRAGLTDNRAGRIDNRQEWANNRQDRRNEVRDQFHDNHPRYDFWKDNPNWARWRWNRPYRWATWAAVTSWFPWGWTQPVTYSYGENVYYEGDQVYYGDQPVATADEYAEQAQEIVQAAPQANEEAEWMSLGVFALTQDGQASGPPPNVFLQLAVNKDGLIAGTLTNTSTEGSKEIEGLVDQKSQRSAWGVKGADWPIMETGISSLTKDEAAALVHFEDGQTQQWLMVRLEEPEEGQQ